MSRLSGLDELAASLQLRSTTPVDPSIEARVLKDLLPVVLRRCPFAVDDIVVQSKAYATYTFAQQPVIVTHVFARPKLCPVDDTSDIRNDMVILCRLPQGTVQEFCVQSWRFEKYAGEIA